MLPDRSHSQSTSQVFRVSDAWKKTCAGSHLGLLLVLNASPLDQGAALEQRKRHLETETKQRYAGLDRHALQQLPIFKTYAAYYKRFNKSYHVLLQLESILFRGKSIPTVAPLVDAMFMAEMSNHLLTAGHDLNLLHLPLTLDVAQGTESYVLLQGETRVPKAGDMMISDGEGIISSIVYGPDQRSRIRPGTRNALYATYAPAGITEAEIDHHMGEISANVRLAAPDSKVDLLALFG